MHIKLHKTRFPRPGAGGVPSRYGRTRARARTMTQWRRRLLDLDTVLPHGRGARRKGVQLTTPCPGDALSLPLRPLLLSPLDLQYRYTRAALSSTPSGRRNTSPRGPDGGVSVTTNIVVGPDRARRLLEISARPALRAPTDDRRSRRPRSPPSRRSRVQSVAAPPPSRPRLHLFLSALVLPPPPRIAEDPGSVYTCVSNHDFHDGFPFLSPRRAAPIPRLKSTTLFPQAVGVGSVNIRRKSTRKVQPVDRPPALPPRCRISSPSG